jgi:outer membrane protein assembly factor BamB
MLKRKTGEPTLRKPLRLWPGVVAAVLLMLARFGIKAVVPGFKGFAWGAQGGFIGVVAIVVWWTFLSRVAWSERLGAIALMIVTLGATWSLRHESMGPVWLFAYAILILCLAFVAWALTGHRLSDRPRRATMVATILLACGVWTAVRTDGITGDGTSQFAWRWVASGEEQLLAQASDQLIDSAQGRPVALPSVPAAAEISKERLVSKASDEPSALTSAPAALPLTPAAETIGADWPGFRGTARDGVIRGVRIETDWSASPPVKLWRRPLGPGWSSFAVRGNLVYTQEQRGDNEVVTCYDVTTGELVWTHHDSARFFESNGGAGPRATPTLSHSRVYSFGATGILNALDASNGAVVWSRNAAPDTSVKVPYWGFASSPLVTGDVVIVYAGALVAYDLATGNPRWFRPASGVSYSSPHLLTIDGVEQVLILNNAGVTSVSPADGTLLWEHPWPGSHIVQPAIIGAGDVLITGEGGSACAASRSRVDPADGPSMSAGPRSG